MNCEMFACLNCFVFWGNLIAVISDNDDYSSIVYVRSSRSKYRKQFKQQKLEKKDNEPKRKEDNDSDDNWDFYEVDLPYNWYEMIFNIHLH